MGLFDVFKKNGPNKSTNPMPKAMSKQQSGHYDVKPPSERPRPILPKSTKDCDIVIPSKKDGATLAYQYSVAMPAANLDVALDAAEKKQWYLTASIVNGNIHLLSGDADLGVLDERSDMMKDWLRREDPYLVILERVNSGTGCTVRLIFYRDKRKQYENREQSVVALVGYKSEEKQGNLVCDEGDEVETEENFEKEECVVISTYLGNIGNLPKKYSKRFLEEGAALVVFDHSEMDSDLKEKPFVRIYW